MVIAPFAAYCHSKIYARISQLIILIVSKGQRTPGVPRRISRGARWSARSSSPSTTLFRATARRFFETECAPHADEWERDGITARRGVAARRRAGPARLGGAGGVRRRRASTTSASTPIIDEEMHATGAVGVGLGLQNDICPPYLIDLTTDEQKARWLPGFVSGEMITAIAMSEPGAGSDLAGHPTTAVRDGDHYVSTARRPSSATASWPTSSSSSRKTDPAAGHKGISLLVVERGMPGFERGRKLDKIGMQAPDTAELFFNDVRVPAANLLGEENRGFYHLMRNLPAGAAGIAVNAVAARRARARADAGVRRRAHGLRHSRSARSRSTGFALADMTTELDVAQVYVDRCIERRERGELTAEEAAGAKLWTTETAVARSSTAACSCTAATAT